MMEFSHRRKNILTGEWIQVSPQRTQRPWQGKQEEVTKSIGLKHDDSCYLCPGNIRANGIQNPHYQDVYIFENDFAALQSNIETFKVNEKDLLVAHAEKGICKVALFFTRTQQKFG
jgi:UDPglucose--hexose-1-phosphate uridylyltransferase